MARSLSRPRVTVGAHVWWMHTEGGGGGSGHRPNAKTPRAAVVQALGPRAVRIRVLDRPEGYASIWVRRANIAPVAA